MTAAIAKAVPWPASPPEPQDRSIGAILVDAGKLSVANVEAILHLQRTENLRFGEAALKLGLLEAKDVQLALASQFDYPYLMRGESQVSTEVVAAYDPFGREVEELRALRSQLSLRAFGAELAPKALALCSPARGEGRSRLAANLAVVFSQLGEHTLLIDGDLRHPRQHQLFGLDNGSGLSSILSSRGGPESIRRIPDLLDLSVLPSGPLPPNPQELLSRPLFYKLLQELADEFGIVLIDTPAGSYADGQIIASRAGAALLVARRHKSALPRLQALAGSLRDAGAAVVGTALGRF
jgi:receptor protein-tyrosine kinase